MMRYVPRALLAMAAAIFTFGSVMHARAYESSLTRVEATGLPRFLVTELKVLWLADSSTLLAASILFGYLAANPAAASRLLIALIALVPLGTTALLYFLLGPFYAGHMLLAACVMIFAAAALLPARPVGPADGLRAQL